MTTLTPEVETAIQQVVAWMAAGNADGATAALDQVTDAGVPALYAGCAVWAEIVRKLTLPGAAPGAHATLLVFDDTGRQVVPEDLPPELAPPVWAARFVAAGAGGPESAYALFAAHAGDPARLVSYAVALAGMAAGALRHHAAAEDGCE